MKALAYVMQELKNPNESFMGQWGKLSKPEQEQVKAWAKAEMQVLGIPVDE